MQTINDMQIVLYAQPYDISANGFFFSSVEEYQKKSALNRNSLFLPVEEYEIQFIDGTNLDADLFKALNINQTNFGAFFDACNSWRTDQKHKVIIAVGDCGCAFELKTDDPDELDVEIYEMDSLRELAEHFVDEGLYGEIPESIKYHLDYDSIARDLSMSYSEIAIDGTRLVYRCG